MLCLNSFRQLRGNARVFCELSRSSLPSAENNSHVQVSLLGEVFSEPLHNVEEKLCSSGKLCAACIQHMIPVI